jgi:diguanylate cyclase (GGDEF)-like protein/PAS domain S-box-containing protein
VVGPLDPAIHPRVVDAIEALDRPGHGLVVFDVAGRPVRMNFEARELLGADWPVANGSVPLGHELVGPDGVPLAFADLPRSVVVRTGRPLLGARLGLRAGGGDVRWLDTWSLPVFDDAGEVAAVVSAVRDVPRAAGEGHPARAALDTELEATVPQAVVASDGDGRVMFANPVAERLYGFTAGTVLGRPLADVLTWDLPPARLAALLTGGPEGHPWSGHVPVVRADGVVSAGLATVTPFVVDGEPVATITSVVDALDRAAAHEVLARRGDHDDLTGLPNRAHFGLRLDEALAARAAGDDLPITVVLTDVDDFKLVNDGFGHRAGDRVLAAVGHSLRRSAHTGDVVARIAGSTFAVCCTHLGPEADPRDYADRLRDAVSTPIQLGHAELVVRCSAGIASGHGDGGESGDELLQRAAIALSQAQDRGKDRSWVYDEALRRRIVRRFDIEAVIRRALACGEVPLEYQPIVALDGDRVVGAEALVRLVDDAGQPIGALEAIDVAESRGLIGPLGLLILETACREAARWQAAEPERALGVSVNVSARQLDDLDLPTRVATVLDEVGLDPARLTLEMTESVLMADVARSTELLAKLKMGGVRLSADDFGTGYSSLAYLKQFPLDSIKADLSFVAGLPDSPEDVAVVGAIMGVANALGLDVVAEGVEHPRQVDALRSLDCALGQGRHWSWSVPGHEFLARVDQIERRTASALVESARGGAGRLHPERHQAPALVETSVDTAFRALAHEIRGPLTVVLGCSSMLEEDGVSDRAAAGRIRHAADRIERLVRDLDDAHALDGGRLELRSEPVDLTELTRRVAGEVGDQLGSPIWVEPLLIGAATVLGDPLRIEQIVANLLANAAKFSSPEADVLVLVGRRRRSVEVSVHDEGPGIPRDQLGVIFRKYGRLDRSLPGSGIGLYLARGLARAHGGDVTYKDRRDRQGSVFTLRLPSAGAAGLGAPWRAGHGAPPRGPACP